VRWPLAGIMRLVPVA